MPLPVEGARSTLIRAIKIGWNRTARKVTAEESRRYAAGASTEVVSRPGAGGEGGPGPLILIG